MSLLECAVCRSPGKLCSRCRVDAYCGPEHQKRDWPRHRAGCGVYELEGSRLRALKDIKQGTVIIKEGPSVLFPRPVGADLSKQWKPGSLVACVGCCFVAPAGWLQCSLCGLPVCGEQCAQRPLHQEECAAFQRARYKIKKRDLSRQSALWPLGVAALRTALAARRDPRLSSLPTDWGRDLVRPDTYSVMLPKGTAHAVLTAPDDDYVKAQRLCGEAAKWLRRTVGVTWLSEAELLRAATLANLHSHSLVHTHRPVEEKRPLSQGNIHLGFCQLEHSCVPNTVCLYWKSAKFNEYVIVASRDISKGEYLSRDFLVDGWLQDTGGRQLRLLRRFGFLCRCLRCEDPTDLGQYVSSPLCPDCAKKGQYCYIVVSASPRTWECQGCCKRLSWDEMKEMTRGVHELQQHKYGQNGVAGYRKWLEFLVEIHRRHGPLHPMHTYVLSAKANMRSSIVLHRVVEEATKLEQKVWEDVCRDLLEAMDRLGLRVHEYRGQVLMSLLALVGRRHCQTAQKARDAAFSPGGNAGNAQFTLDDFMSAQQELNVAQHQLKQLESELKMYYPGSDMDDDLYPVS